VCRALLLDAITPRKEWAQRSSTTVNCMRCGVSSMRLVCVSMLLTALPVPVAPVPVPVLQPFRSRRRPLHRLQIMLRWLKPLVYG